MPLDAYGVLVGTLNRFTRENPDNFGSWYHGKIYVQAPAGEYECAVDVSTPAGIKVQYRVIHNIDQAMFANNLALTTGWHLLASTPTSGAIDYVRSSMFKGKIGCMGVALAWLGELLRKIFEGLVNRWIDSTGDNALDELEAQLTGCTRVFVFGAPYTSGLGVHDIHMNQGDPPGQFQHLDGIWQDGGTIVERPGGELVAVLTKFETQSLHTDTGGLPT
jgi:uncharacterized protein YukJ